MKKKKFSKKFIYVKTAKLETLRNARNYLTTKNKLCNIITSAILRFKFLAVFGIEFVCMYGKTYQSFEVLPTPLEDF